MNPDAHSVSLAVESLAILADLGVRSTVVLGLSLGTAHLLRRRTAAARHAVLTAAVLSVPLAGVLSRAMGGAFVEPVATAALSLPAGVVRTLLLTWMVGVAVTAAPLLRSLFALVGVARGASEVDWLRGLDGGRARVRAADVAVPLTFGWLRPVVLFPRGAGDWSAAERETALAHELAHVRRGDWIVQVAVRLAVSLAWFQPLGWIAWRRLLLEAEQAADDGVLAGGTPASTYSEHLLARCTELARLVPGAVAMAPRSPSQLETRVRAVLAPVRARSASGLPVFGGVLGALLLGLPLADASTDVESPPTCEAPSGPALDYDTLITRPGAEAGIRWLTARLEGMPAMERQVPEAAASVVVRNCPYRRSGVELVALLDRELPKLVAATSGEVAAQLGATRDLVVLHRRYLEAMAVLPVLPEPEEGDYLAAWVDEERLVGVEGETEGVYPEVARALDAIPDLVSAMPQEIADRLGAAQRDLAPDSGDLLLQPLAQVYDDGLRVALRHVEASSEEEVAAQVEARIHALRSLVLAFTNQGC